MKYRKQFLGLDGFFWWFGVVENRHDPAGLGRCQVRVYGTHTDNLSDIPSDDLPWAYALKSVNDSRFGTLKEGDMVFGFFVDGKNAQLPVMVGVMDGIPDVLHDLSAGFADLRSDDELLASPKKPESIEFKTDGSGAKIIEKRTADGLRNPQNIGEPTTPRLARHEKVNTTNIQKRRDNLVSVKTAEGREWKEPAPAYNAVYPYNSVKESESGHVVEVDDTPGAERISTTHRSGTFEEFYPSGSKVEKIVRNRYAVVMGDDHLYVMGKVNITVDSGAFIRVVGDANILVESDVNLKVAGDMNTTVGGDFNVKAKNVNLEATVDMNLQSQKNLNTDSAILNLHNGSSVGSGLGTAPSKGTPTSGNPPEEPTPVDRAGYFVDAGESGVDEYIDKMISDGVYKKDEVSQSADELDNDITKPKKLDPKTTSCGGVENLPDFPASLQLTTNFNLGSVTGHTPYGDVLKAQRGLTKGQIVCNLKLLAENVLEPIFTKYPNMIVTNAFRLPIGSYAGASQHEIGQAADLQFTGASKSDYYEIAQWIRDNVAYDKLILEYKTFGSSMPWIHISFNKENNRCSILTFLNHKRYKDSLSKLA